MVGTIRASNSGYAHGTSGSPQGTLEQNEYTAKVAENEAKLKAEADNAPLIDPLHIAEMEAGGAKFTRKNIVFTARDKTGQVVWLAKGTKTAGLDHLKARGHISQLAKYLGVSENDVPSTLRNVIRDGRIVSDKTVKRGSSIGHERKYEYNGRHIVLAAIGTNGFLVTVYPDD